MGLEIQQILIGDNNSYLDSFLVKKNKLVNDTNKLNIFLIMDTIDKILHKFDSKLHSISNINYINDNSFLLYEELIEKKYEMKNIIIPFGFGSCFNTINNEKFRIISIDQSYVNGEALFLLNPPICNLIDSFSEKFDYDCKNGLCDFSDFDYLKYLTSESIPENYSAKLIGLTGHIHSKTGEVFLNDTQDIFLKNSFFIEDIKQISEFIKNFRNYEKSYKLNVKIDNNFDYSYLILSHEEKYYYYSEATSLTKNNHHDRLGIITELIPNKKGLSGSKISNINYFECLNNLKIFQEIVNNNRFNSKFLISNISSKLGLFFK
jgi:hypothetical protein